MTASIQYGWADEEHGSGDAALIVRLWLTEATLEVLWRTEGWGNGGLETPQNPTQSIKHLFRALWNRCYFFPNSMFPFKFFWIPFFFFFFSFNYSRLCFNGQIIFFINQKASLMNWNHETFSQNLFYFILIIYFPNTVFSITFMDSILMVSLNCNNQKHLQLINFI